MKYFFNSPTCPPLRVAWVCVVSTHNIVQVLNKGFEYIVYEAEIPDKAHLLKAVGLDWNCGQVALSDGTIYRLPDLKRKHYQRMVVRRQKRSNRRKPAKHGLHRAHQAERFARANWCHRTSKLIADQYDIVYMEGLNTVGMTKSAKGTTEKHGKHVKAKSGLNQEILKSGWYKLEQCLSYKAHIERVNPAYTTQTCNECGTTDKVNRKTQSKFKCRYCGHEDKVDINATLNILAVGSTAAGHGGIRVVRPVRRQRNEIAKRANQLVKLST